MATDPGVSLQKLLQIGGRHGVRLVEGEELHHRSGADLLQHRPHRFDLRLRRSGLVESTTWTSRLDSVTTSSVERNASTSQVRAACARNRRCRTTAPPSPPGSSRRRVRGSSVANNLSSTSTPASVSMIEQGGFSGVGVTDQRNGGQAAGAAGTCAAAGVVEPSRRRSASNRFIRRTRRRRSTSSWVSPGPLVPMPPASRESWVPRPRRRGSRYRSWASSTWARPSWVRAFWAKMSRITAVRSIAVRPRIFSRLRDRAGTRAPRQTPPCRRRPRLDRSPQLLRLALAHVGGRVRVVASLHHPGGLVRTGGVDQQGQLVEMELGLDLRLGGDADADEHDLLPERPIDQAHRAGSTSHRQVATRARWAGQGDGAVRPAARRPPTRRAG